MKITEERQWIIKLIFQNEFNELKLEKEYIQDLLIQFDVKATDFIIDSVISIIKNKEKIDTLINSKLNKGNITSLLAIDLSILRVSINEFYIEKKIPTNVSISEAVKNAKIFSSENSKKLINGILSSISKEM